MESTHEQSALTSYTTTIALTCAVCIILYFFINKRPKYKGNVPPGPTPVPLFGNLLDVRKSDEYGPGIFDKWADEFGAIYTVRFGSYDAVVLNSTNIIKEVFVNQGAKSTGRQNSVFFFKMTVGKNGLVMNEGQRWKDTRRLAIHSLRDLGMGKKSLELKIQEEASALVDAIDQYGEKPFNPKLALHNATSNIICCVVFGERYDYNDPDFTRLSDWLNIFFSGGGFKNPELFVPILTPLIPILNRTCFQAIRCLYRLRSYIKKKIEQHRDNFDPEDLKSFIDICLKGDEGKINDKALDDNILTSIFDLFLAGSETSLTSLRWTILYLVNNPQVQAKCQQEIAKEIGQVRAPNNGDRDRLPYIEATMYEIQRICSIASYGLLHRSLEDIEVDGYTIPKNYLIMSNLHRVHMDPEYWGDPKVFRPERWLGEDGKLIKHEAFMPFAIGPRECPGRNLALQEMFIVMVSLLQKFTFKAIDQNNPPKICGTMAVTHSPNDYEIIASRC